MSKTNILNLFNLVKVNKVLKKFTLFFLVATVIISFQNTLLTFSKGAVKQETFLTLNYTKPISINELKNVLNYEIGDIDKIQINNISSELQIGDKTQAYSESNEFDSTSKFLHNYSKKYSAFIPTLLKIKSKNINYQDNSAIIKKYSTEEILNSASSNSKIKIKLLTLSGAEKHIIKISKIFNNNIANLFVYNIAENQSFIKELNNKTISILNTEEKINVIKTEIEKKYGKVKNSVETLNEDLIKKVDKKILRDLSGNLYLNALDGVISKLTSSEIQAIKNALYNYNQIPLAVRDGSNQAIESIVNSDAIMEEVRKQNTLKDKFESIISGKVNANAWCQRSIRTYWQWWGIQSHLNDCIINDINLAGGTFAAITGFFAATPCSWACGVLALITAISMGYINWLNQGCGGDGVMLNRSWNGNYWFWAVC